MNSPKNTNPCKTLKFCLNMYSGKRSFGRFMFINNHTDRGQTPGLNCLDGEEGVIQGTEMWPGDENQWNGTGRGNIEYCRIVMRYGTRTPPALR